MSAAHLRRRSSSSGSSSGEWHRHRHRHRHRQRQRHRHRGIDGSELVGFATIHGAELCALHVDPHAWGRGVGRALIAQARADLAAAGVAEAHVWVLAGNARAERFYERDGWSTDGTRRPDTVWGAAVDELAYRRRV